MNENDVVLFGKDGGVYTVTINRPARRNALTAEVFSVLERVFVDIAGDGEARIVVLRGAGTAAFSSGYEIGQLDSSVDFGEKNQMEGVCRVIDACPVPVIAMVYGYCMAGGLGLAVSCDLRIAAENARFGTTPAKLGVVYPAAGILRYINTIGVPATKELFYTGRTIDAARAREIRLVDHVVDTRDLENFTYAMAREIAGNAPLSVRGAKTVISRLLSYQHLPDDAKREIIELQLRAAASEDFAEGRQAFAEKRKPAFKGR